MNYHGLLDWRLGLSLLRCLANPGFTAGLDGDFTAPDLDGWVAVRRGAPERFLRHLLLRTHATFGPLPGFEIGGIAGRHRAPAVGQIPPAGAARRSPRAVTPRPLKHLDTFNLLRRESWSYQSLAG